jgi:sugar (pentulose or hexulose) kinase
MSNDPIILAVDLGTSGMKAALITVSGKVLGAVAIPTRRGLPTD